MRSGVSSVPMPGTGPGAAAAAMSSSAGGAGTTLVIQVSGNTLLTESYETTERLARLLQPALDRISGT